MIARIEIRRSAPHLSAMRRGIGAWLAGVIASQAFCLTGCDRRSAQTGSTSQAIVGNVRPDLAGQLAQIEAQEETVNKTIWAKEILAEECGRVFERGWDRINAATTNKLAVMADFAVGELVLGSWKSPLDLSHGIVLRNSTGPSAVLTQDQWRSWLTAMTQSGWQLAQMEIRHQRFATDAEGRPQESQFYFSAHLSNAVVAERAILEGDLIVTWGAPTADESVIVTRIDARRVVVKTRRGAPPFQLILKEQLGPANQSFSTEPLMVYDLDGDGLSEIILPAKNLVYHRQGDGNYRGERLCRHPTRPFLSGLVADFDGDGRADLLCATREGLVLFRGNGGATFDDEGQTVWRAEPNLVNPMVITCGDVDGDGDLDVFLGQYKLPYQEGQMPTPYYDANDGDPAYLLLNEGQGHFKDATARVGLGSKRHRRSLSGSLADLNGDGHLDLVVVSDFSGTDVYRGDGHGHFTEVTREWFPDLHGFGMGHVLSDFNADGRLDLFVTGMPSPTADRLEQLGLWRTESAENRNMRASMTYGNRLYFGTGEGRFDRTPANSSIARSGWSWGCSALDFDNDGFPDLYIGNGMETRGSVEDYDPEFWLHDIYVADSRNNPNTDLYFKGKLTRLRSRGVSYGGHEKNRFYLNQGGSSFIEVAYLLGVALESDSRSVVSADLDGDGRMDLLVTSYEPGPDSKRTLRIYRNTLEDGGHWIGFHFREESGEPSPVGVEVMVRAGGRSAVHQLVTGDSHHSQHPNTLHFGLGALDQVDSVSIRNPHGEMHTLQSPAVNCYHTIQLGLDRPLK